MPILKGRQAPEHGLAAEEWLLQRTNNGRSPRGDNNQERNIPSYHEHEPIKNMMKTSSPNQGQHLHCGFQHSEDSTRPDRKRRATGSRAGNQIIDRTLAPEVEVRMTFASPARIMGRLDVAHTCLALWSNSCQNATRSPSGKPAWGAQNEQMHTKLSTTRQREDNASSMPGMANPDTPLLNKKPASRPRELVGPSYVKGWCGWRLGNSSAKTSWTHKTSTFSSVNKLTNMWPSCTE